MCVSTNSLATRRLGTVLDYNFAYGLPLLESVKDVVLAAGNVMAHGAQYAWNTTYTKGSQLLTASKEGLSSVATQGQEKALAFMNDARVQSALATCGKARDAAFTYAQKAGSACVDGAQRFATSAKTSIDAFAKTAHANIQNGVAIAQNNPGTVATFVALGAVAGYACKKAYDACCNKNTRARCNDADIQELTRASEILRTYVPNNRNHDVVRAMTFNVSNADVKRQLENKRDELLSLLLFNNPKQIRAFIAEFQEEIQARIVSLQ